MKLSKLEQYRQAVLRQKMLEAGTPSDIPTLKNLVDEDAASLRELRQMNLIS